MDTTRITLCSSCGLRHQTSHALLVAWVGFYLPLSSTSSQMPHIMLAGTAWSIFLGYERFRLAMIETNSSRGFVRRGLYVFSSMIVLLCRPWQPLRSRCRAQERKMRGERWESLEEGVWHGDRQLNVTKVRTITSDVNYSKQTRVKIECAEERPSTRLETQASIAPDRTPAGPKLTVVRISHLARTTPCHDSRTSIRSDTSHAACDYQSSIRASSFLLPPCFRQNVKSTGILNLW